MFVNNEKIKKYFNKILCFIYSLIFAFSYCFYFASPVYALGNNWTESGLFKSAAYISGAKAVNSNTSGSRYVAISVADSNGNPPGPPPHEGSTADGRVGVVAYTSYSMSQVYNGASFTGSNLGLLFYTSGSDFHYQLLYSSNNLSFTPKVTSNINLTRTASNGSVTGETIYYHTVNNLNTNFSVSWNPATIKNFQSVFPDIPLICGITYPSDIVDVISLDLPSSSWPWNYSTASGGLHFSNGNDLSADNTTLYSNVYTLMNVDNSSTITEDEVNYYNYTYNTNYDFAAVNNGNAFSEFQFLQYVAGVITGGGNPAGDGNNPVPDGGSGGVNVNDSFNPSVVVNNNNSLSQESLQYIDQIINNGGTEEDQATFQEAISNVKGFSGLVKSFGSLFIDFLDLFPAGVKKLFSMVFSAIPVFITLRLIKLI